MPLWDVQCRNAKSREKAWKLTDGEGLCLFVKPNGSAVASGLCICGEAQNGIIRPISRSVIG